MESFGLGTMAGLLAGSAALFVPAVALAKWRRRRRLARTAPAAGSIAASAPAATAAAASAVPAAGGARLAALEAAQADLAARLDALAAEGGAEEKLQALARQLLGLIRDKNATFETAIAGLDQLRARMKTLEQMGAPAEARALMDGIEARLDEAAAARTADAAALEVRLRVLEAAPATPPEAPFAEIADQLTRLYAQKDAGLAALMERLAPLEEKLATLAAAQAAPGADAQARAETARLGVKLEALAEAQGATAAEIAAVRAAPGPAAEIAARLAELHAGRDALAETVLARLATLEAGIAARDPQALLDRFAERLEGLKAAQAAETAALGDRLAALEDPGERPFAAISDQLTQLYAQKDATVETVFARLAPMEEKLAALAARDPQALLDRFAERLEVLKAAQAAETAALGDRLAALEAPGESPFAAISDQLTQLYAQKDATVETVFARLAPMEEKLAALAARDPQALLDRFAERLEGLKAAQAAETAALGDRLAALEDPGESPFAEISGQLTKLYAQKDATVETVFARLAPMEEKLAALAARDPQALLDRFAERLAAVQDRVAALEDPGESPFAAISDQLVQLYAQKDATVETVFARLAPMEAQLAALAPLAEADPRAEIDGLCVRIETVARAQGEVAAGLAAMHAAHAEAGAGTAALGEIADQLTRLYAQKDAGLAALLARIAPLEARLATLEDRPWDPDAEEARARAQAIAAQLIALRTAAEQTEVFADRLALLEASLPKLSSAQTLLMQALERQAAPALPLAEPAPASVLPKAAPADPAAEMAEVWAMPRLVSLHRK